MFLKYNLTLDDNGFNDLMQALKFNEEYLDSYVAKKLGESCLKNKKRVANGLIEIPLSDKVLTELIQQLLRSNSHFLEELKLKEIKGNE